MVSETFDPSLWEEVAGFDFEDITYHRARAHGTVRIAFDDPNSGQFQLALPLTKPRRLWCDRSRGR